MKGRRVPMADNQRRRPHRENVFMRGRLDRSDLSRTRRPVLQSPSRSNASISPTRASNRSKSPSETTQEAKEYDKAVATRDRSDPPGTGIPLSQRVVNKRVAGPAKNNTQKRRTQGWKDRVPFLSLAKVLGTRIRGRSCSRGGSW